MLKGTGCNTIMSHKNGEVYQHPFSDQNRRPRSTLQHQEQLSDSELRRIEQSLTSLNIEKDGLVHELGKLPDMPRKGEQIHRKVWIEDSLASVNKQIGHLKQRLRQANAI